MEMFQKKPRIWFVEDIHNQTGEWVKAYARRRDCTVEVVEIGSEIKETLFHRAATYETEVTKLKHLLMRVSHCFTATDEDQLLIMDDIDKVIGFPVGRTESKALERKFNLLKPWTWL